jgi:hypothetical protein
MTDIAILFIMILLHIIDDFVLQPVCLSKLKQKEFWKRNVSEEDYNKLYEHDYFAALVIHGLSWSIMIHLPFLLIGHYHSAPVACFIICQCILHSYIDNEKANKKKINLIDDQAMHFAQIVISWCLLTL